MIARQHAGRQPTPYLLPIYSRPTNHYLLPTYSSLPTPYLPITTYSLPTTYYSLPTTYLLPTLEPALRTFSLVDLEVPDIEKFACSNVVFLVERTLRGDDGLTDDPTTPSQPANASVGGNVTPFRRRQRAWLQSHELT